MNNEMESTAFYVVLGSVLVGFVCNVTFSMLNLYNYYYLESKTRKFKKTVENKFDLIDDHIRGIHSDIDDIKEELFENERRSEDREYSETEGGSDKEEEKSETEGGSEGKNSLDYVLKLLSDTNSAIKSELLKANNEDPGRKEMIHQMFDLINNQFQKIVNTGENEKKEDPHQTSEKLLSDVRSMLIKKDN